MMANNNDLTEAKTTHQTLIEAMNHLEPQLTGYLSKASSVSS
jgi:hypothetical protein